MPRKLLKFLIIFDNSSLLYFPGQFLSGRVLIELQHETPALALHFHVVGEGVVQVRSARQDRTYDKESYIDFRMKLLGDNGANSDFYVEAGGSAAPSATIISGATTTLLSPGIHSFPFKLGLPHGLPSTFLGRYGWIQYYCKAALREANGLIHKNHQVFIVMNPIDLNYEEQILSQPFKCDIEHRVGGIGCIGGGHVKCFVSLDRGGYVPGENITVTATIKNLSQTTIKQTRVALTETIKYLAHGKCIQIERRELAQIVHGKIRPMAKDDWYNEQLYVPPLPPTNLRGCHLIKIQYDVFFIIEPKSMERPIKLQLPIVLGTYPFRQRSSPLTGSTDELANTWPESILKPDTHYPSTLPIFRPWLHEKADVK